MLQFSHLQGDCNISHFTTTRHGGVSQGEYATFNLGAYCGDDPEAVKMNRAKLCHALSLSADRLFVPNQTHGSAMKELDEEFLLLSAEDQEAILSGVDALITRVPAVCIAVTTADCVPVLLYAPDKKVIAAIHAGWRGTVLQIVYKVVCKLIESYGCDPLLLKAGIGPSISRDYFEVGKEVVDAFLMIYSDLDRIVTYSQDTNNPHIDLWEANRQQLLKAGLEADNIETAGLCTFIDSNDFFSARRQGVQSGRMLSGIFLTK